MSRAAVLDLAAIGDDEPIRLDTAARLFPDGGMTVSGLRRERDRGTLIVERIAGKDYTCKAAIRRMRELCRAKAKESASISNQPRETMPQSGSSETGQDRLALDAALASVRRLKSPLPTISHHATKHQGGNVVSLKSDLQT